MTIRMLGTFLGITWLGVLAGSVFVRAQSGSGELTPAKKSKQGDMGLVPLPGPERGWWSSSAVIVDRGTVVIGLSPAVGDRSTTVQNITEIAKATLDAAGYGDLGGAAEAIAQTLGTAVGNGSITGAQIAAIAKATLDAAGYGDLGGAAEAIAQTLGTAVGNGSMTGAQIAAIAKAILEALGLGEFACAIEELSTAAGEASVPREDNEGEKGGDLVPMEGNPSGPGNAAVPEPSSLLIFSIAASLAAGAIGLRRWLGPMTVRNRNEKISSNQ